jgi:Mrp family chromosome partitioning ATPase
MKRVICSHTSPGKRKRPQTMSKNFELLQRAGWGEEYLEGIPVPVYTRHSPASRQQTAPRPTDQISTLVQRLFQRSGGPHIRCVVFLGCTETGSGTSVCARTAQNLAARVQDRVCVVDAKFEYPSMHRFFGKDNVAGLRDAVSHSRRGDNFVKQVEESNLWVLSAGDPGTGRRAAVSQRGLAECLMEIRADFQYVLIDAPPLSGRSELSALGQVADGAVLVVNAWGVSADMADRGRARLRRANVRLLGMVLNQDQASFPGA